MRMSRHLDVLTAVSFIAGLSALFWCGAVMPFTDWRHSNLGPWKFYAECVLLASGPFWLIFIVLVSVLVQRKPDV